MASLNRTSFPEQEIVDCPKCKEGIKLYDPEGSEFCVCQSCHSFIRFTEVHPLGTVQKNVPTVKHKPVIPLGTVGSLKGYDFKVTAYLEKKEKDTVYTWEEYILYNYEHGYATLAVFNGHWNFIIDKSWDPALEKPYSNGIFATYEGAEYRIFNKYTPVTTGLIGELDWDVFSDNPKTHEYVAPPFILSKELDSPGSKTAQYYLGEYTEPHEIARAFGLDVKNLPKKEGIGANEGSPHAVGFDDLAKFSVYAVLILMVMCFLIKVLKPEREILNSDFNITFDGNLASIDSISNSSEPKSFEFKPFITSSFNQPDDKTVLEVEVGSQVDNNWLEVNVLLVNDLTNETWEVTKGIEYYHGYEGGESWTEGSTQESIMLSEIPKGKYHLNISPVSGDFAQTTMSVRITSNVTLWRNIFLTVLILSLYPFYCWYRMYRFEKSRWMNSDYSPYETE